MKEKELLKAQQLQTLINRLKEDREKISKSVGFRIHEVSHSSCDSVDTLICLNTELEIYKKVLIDGLTAKIKELEEEFNNL